MTAEVPKGPLDALLLATLAGGPRHGYAIKEALRADSGGRFDLPTGTIYPALHRLERAGLIRGPAPAVNGRRRRSYQLTAAGRPAQRRALLLTGVLCRGHHPARGGTMAGAGMSDPQPDPLGDDAVEDYLATIAAQLTGLAAARAAIADELRDGLLETRQAHLSHGRSAWELRSPADQQATLPLTPVVIAALAAATADLTLLAIIAGHALTTPGALRWAPVVVAVVASLARGTLPAQAARRCLGTRAALT